MLEESNFNFRLLICQATWFRYSKRKMAELFANSGVIPGEEVAVQHQLLVCDMRIDVPPKILAQVHPSPQSLEA